MSNLLSLLRSFVGATQVANAQAPTYPPTAKGNVADEYHGQKVADPYRWLEDLGSVDTKAWIDAENAITLPYLERLPQRAPLIERLTQLWNYPRTDLPLREAGHIFYRQNMGLQKQSPLYRLTRTDCRASSCALKPHLAGRRRSTSRISTPRSTRRRAGGRSYGYARWR